MKRLAALLPLAPPVLLGACATQVSSTAAPAAPGFLLGVWHGLIFPVAWLLSLVMPEVAVGGRGPSSTLSARPAGSRRAVPNNGGWYDFGFFVGVVFLGVSARKSRTVYVERRVRR